MDLEEVVDPVQDEEWRGEEPIDSLWDTGLARTRHRHEDAGAVAGDMQVVAHGEGVAALRVSDLGIDVGKEDARVAVRLRDRGEGLALVARARRRGVQGLVILRNVHPTTVAERDPIAGDEDGRALRVV